MQKPRCVSRSIRPQWVIAILFVVLCSVGQAGEDNRAGLAAEYVNDEGIAKDHAVIFAEDFEDDRLPARGWYDLHDWKKHLLITDEDKATGSKCMKLIYPKGSTGPWFRAPHFKYGYETLHVRYYRKWADGWNWGGPGDGNGHETRLVANGPELPKQAYKGNDMVVLMMESSTHFNPWKRGLFGLMLYTHQPYLTMGKMNTPGKADGELKGWIDGKLVYHVRNCMIRDGKAAGATWRRWWVGPYFHGGVTKDQHSYIDSLVVATEYIGPVARK